MTGKEWTIIRGVIGSGTNATVAVPSGTQGGGIIGVASKSGEIPFRTNFKDTALENILAIPVVTNSAAPGAVLQAPPDLGGETAKYSQWQFIAEPPQKNDHSKIYRAYHESW